MNIEALICPQCGGALTQKSKFCPYCGCELSFGNEITYNYNYTNTNTADVIKAKTEADNDENKWKLINSENNSMKKTMMANTLFPQKQQELKTSDVIAIALAVFAMIAVAGFIMMSSLIEDNAERKKEIAESERIEQMISDGKVSAGAANKYIDNSYKEAEAILKAKGFENIELIDLNDADGEEKIEDYISSISIGGEEYFGSDDYFSLDEKIVITYH